MLFLCQKDKIKLCTIVGLDEARSALQDRSESNHNQHLLYTYRLMQKLKPVPTPAPGLAVVSSEKNALKSRQLVSFYVFQGLQQQNDRSGRRLLFATPPNVAAFGETGLVAYVHGMWFWQFWRCPLFCSSRGQTQEQRNERVTVKNESYTKELCVLEVVK